jgi:ATP-dependent Clp protease ATP-binding subunit ClpA
LLALSAFISIDLSIFAEKESYAVYLLKLNNISRLEVMEAISTRSPESEEEVSTVIKGCFYDDGTKPEPFLRLLLLYLKVGQCPPLLLFHIKQNIKGMCIAQTFQ